MKLPWPVAPTAKHTPRTLLDSSKPCRPLRDASGGKASPWPRPVKPNNESKEFSPGKDQSPCNSRNRLPSRSLRSRFRLSISLLPCTRQRASAGSCAASPGACILASVIGVRTGVRTRNESASRIHAAPTRRCRGNHFRRTHCSAHAVTSPSRCCRRSRRAGAGRSRRTGPIAMPIGPIAQVAPVAPAESSHRGFSYHYGFDDEDRFVIVSGKTDSFTMSGSSQDAHHVEKLRKNIQGISSGFSATKNLTSFAIKPPSTGPRSCGTATNARQEARGTREATRSIGKTAARAGCKDATDSRQRSRHDGRARKTQSGIKAT